MYPEESRFGCRYFGIGRTEDTIRNLRHDEGRNSLASNGAFGTKIRTVSAFRADLRIDDDLVPVPGDRLQGAFLDTVSA